MRHFGNKKLLPIKCAGFSLIELLIAIAIFAIVAIMAYSGLNIVLITNQQTTEDAARLAKLQIALTRLQRDIEQYVRHTNLQGNTSYLEFTRAGWRNPAQQQRSSLQRVAYSIENNSLIRTYWRRHDYPQNPQKLSLLNQIDELRIRYLDLNFQWQQQWNANYPPKAIEVTLTLQQWGQISRLFRIP
jgi:general secretion pathway protein J